MSLININCRLPFTVRRAAAIHTTKLAPAVPYCCGALSLESGPKSLYPTGTTIKSSLKVRPSSSRPFNELKDCRELDQTTKFRGNMSQKSKPTGADHHHRPRHRRGAEWPHGWCPCVPAALPAQLPPASPIPQPPQPCPAPSPEAAGQAPAPWHTGALGPGVRHLSTAVGSHLSRENRGGSHCLTVPWPARHSTREQTPQPGACLSSSQPHGGSCGAPGPQPGSGGAVTARLAGVPSEYFILHNITTQRCCSCTAFA